MGDQNSRRLTKGVEDLDFYIGGKIIMVVMGIGVRFCCCKKRNDGVFTLNNLFL